MVVRKVQLEYCYENISGFDIVALEIDGYGFQHKGLLSALRSHLEAVSP